MFDFVRFRKRLHKNKPDRHPTDPATRKNVTFLKNGLMGRSVQSMRYAVDPSAPDEASRRPYHVPILLDALWLSIGPWVALEHGTKVVGESGCIELVREAAVLPQKLTLDGIAYSITVHLADRQIGRHLLPCSHIGAL